MKIATVEPDQLLSCRYNCTVHGMANSQFPPSPDGYMKYAFDEHDHGHDYQWSTSSGENPAWRVCVCVCVNKPKHHIPGCIDYLNAHNEEVDAVAYDTNFDDY